MVRFLLTLVLPLAVILPMSAQIENRTNGAGMYCEQWYNEKKVRTINGKIFTVKQISASKNMYFGTHLIVVYSSGKIEVLLGPSWYLEKNKIRLRRGDVVKVSGAMSTFEGQRSMIAKWLIKNEDTLVLRDEKGFPKWIAEGKNKLGGENRRYKS
jgi:hypothetical protein